MRYARLALSLASTAMMVMPLGGCIIADHAIYPSTAMASSYPGGMPIDGPVGPTYAMNGSTLGDASHAVQRYLNAHYPDAQLVKIHAYMVGTNAKIDETSSWEFTYRVKVADPVATPAPSPSPTPAPSPSPTPVSASGSATASYRVQAVVPSVFRYHLLTFVYTGKNQLLAPEEQDDTGDNLDSVDFSRTILVDDAIATALDIGMGVGAPGMEVSLRTTVNGGAVYELDSSVATRPASTTSTPPRQTMSMYGSSYDQWDYSYGSTYDDPVVAATPTPTNYGRTKYPTTYATPQPAPTPSIRYVRGKYLIDAYTGAIIDRPTNL